MSDNPSVPEVQPSLVITLHHGGPIELGVLTDSLQALASQFARFADARGIGINGDEVRLHVKEIRSGSIIVELVALAAIVPLAITHTSAVLDFAVKLAETVKYFRAEKADPPDDLKPKDAQELSRLVGPTAADPKGMIQIEASDAATVNVKIVMSSNDANAVQNRISHWSATQAAPVSGVRKQQLFYFFQARDDRSAAQGDRGIIEAISKRPIKTIFANKRAKAATLGEALFKKAYVVDVDVQTVDDRPKLYRILEVTDSFDRED